MALLFPDTLDALLQFQQSLDAFRTSGWLGSGPSASGAYPPLNISEPIINRPPLLNIRLHMPVKRG